MLRDPSARVEYWRQQFGLVIHHASETHHALLMQAGQLRTGGATRTRLQGLARAVADQVTDLVLLLGKALGDPTLPRGRIELPRGATDYLSLVFRDWAWPSSHDDENGRSLAAIRRVTRGRELGRTLVLGAGACRLAYDLHVHSGGSETAALDIDPFLLVLAQATIRGATPSLTETSANAPDVDPVSRRWSLSPPSGPLGEEVLHFFLADGTEPPFADHTFDTVVTPWFIDQVPTDLEALLRELHRLLVPEGRWINHGPLVYRPDALPIARWYTRQEIFDLADAVGFQIGHWESASLPHLVSPLTGRGLVENVLTFEAAPS